MKTRNGLEIKLSNDLNGHILVWGRSGQGKTYFLCRKVEDYVEAGKKVLIIDYSGSYTNKEMINNKFKYQSRIDRFQFDYALNWYFRVRDEKNFKKDVTDTFLEVFKCDSYFQQALLENAIDHIFATQERLCIPDIIIELKKMLLREKVEEEAVGNTDNIGRLLTRLRPYETIENFYIKRGVTDRENSGQVVIMDISNFPEKQRKFLTELFLKLLWKESYRQEYENHCDAVILDEMQFLSIKEDDILTAFLREGRKKGFELVYCTVHI